MTYFMDDINKRLKFNRLLKDLDSNCQVSGHKQLSDLKPDSLRFLSKPAPLPGVTLIEQVGIYMWKELKVSQIKMSMW